MLLEVKNLYFKYKDRTVLEDISFCIKSGEVLAILGANGSGKTTLLKVILGLLKPKGDVTIANKSIHKYTKRELASLVSYIPQIHNYSYDYTVLDIVLMGALHRTPLFSSFSTQDKNLAKESLEKMGIIHLSDKPYTKISGGERQLAYIARALVQGAKTIFMDEPTNGLDFGNQIKLLEMIRSLRDDGYTFVHTTHHPRHAKFVSTRVLFLKNGRILGFGNGDEMISNKNISEIYGIEYEKYRDLL
ncbi:MAG: ABC transporter ATP-binding protein [Wolinella sp.]